ncbi:MULTISPECIES: mechanosensitive ion channel family protein [unclassified Sedimentibacter]|uniref:mechanosensitive ion channel family protein n=1 Tax=unclassified Sedimentibacter TaxID=2649220 RepID=UPI0027DFD3D3|nr:mechanosensitive ion channel family protein [Sedimentibacter sp. MB35-C1]WMJ75875.1 mechanosensitive ion channel family protein [Sedimentibacter sp. MB35-C1]
MILTGNLEASTIVKSFFIIVALLMFRSLITKSIIKIIRKLTERYKLSYAVLIIDSIEKPLLNLITYTAVYLGIIVFPINPSIYVFISRLYRAMLIITVTQGLLRLITSYSEALNSNYINEKSSSQMAKTVFPVLSKLIKTVVVILAVVAIAVEFDFKQLSSILAGLGIGGAALALASQDLIKNFFGGFVILTDKSFSVGDWIRVDSFEGTVEELGLRSTKIRTIGKELVIVPNSRFADREVINYSNRENRRASFTLGAVYGTPEEKMKIAIERIKSMLDSHSRVAGDTSIVKFTGFGPSSLDIAVQYFTNTADYAEFMDITNDVNFKIMEIFTEENIEFAFPSMSVYMSK